MVLYIVGRIFYFCAKFDPLEEASLYPNEGLGRTMKLMEAAVFAQSQVDSGKLKIGDNEKYGKHVDTYAELKEQEIIATEARGGHVHRSADGKAHKRQLADATDDLQA